jgi:protein prenyltransferase alpha subunit repeat containing protein 1
MSGTSATSLDATHHALALELDTVLANDPLTDELAFVPSATLVDLFGPNPQTHPPDAVVSATVPGAFVLVEHKLAVALTALVPVYAFAAEALRRADEATRTRESTVDRKSVVGVDPDTGADALRLLLLVNGDHATAWNRRKTRLLHAVKCEVTDERTAKTSSVDSVEASSASDAARDALVAAEFTFAEFILTKFPKARAAWAHRRWIIREISGGMSPERFRSEKRVTEMACLRKRLNYAAWAHRRWCALGRRFPSSFHRAEPGGADAKADSGLRARENVPHCVFLDEELETTEFFVRRNVSDYCGFHHRQALMTSREKRDGAKAPEPSSAAWASELEMISDLIERYPGREALWTHRRFAFHARLVRAASRGDRDENTRARANETHLDASESIVREELEYALLYRRGDGRDAAEKKKSNGWGKNVAAAASAVPLQPSWAEHPAAEQVRFAAAHVLWVLEAGRRFAVAGCVGSEGAAKRKAAAEFLAVAWPWGEAASLGMRAARVGGGAE